jgi:hypothetical protein
VEQQQRHLQLVQLALLLHDLLPARPAVQLAALLPQVLAELAPAAVQSCGSLMNLQTQFQNRM